MRYLKVNILYLLQDIGHLSWFVLRQYLLNKKFWPTDLGTFARSEGLTQNVATLLTCLRLMVNVNKELGE